MTIDGVDDEQDERGRAAWIAEMSKHCRCCALCGQNPPCDGVLAGGLCDDVCSCDDRYDGPDFDDVCTRCLSDVCECGDDGVEYG